MLRDSRPVTARSLLPALTEQLVEQHVRVGGAVNDAGLEQDKDELGESVMNASQMIELMNRTPFESLEIHLSDGSRIVVEQPFQISTSRNSPSCTVYDAHDHMRIVAYRNITEIITAAI